jgi:hypothetical protein
VEAAALAEALIVIAVAEDLALTRLLVYEALLKKELLSRYMRHI